MVTLDLMDISIRSKTVFNEDQRWIGNGGKPNMSPRSIVIDRSGLTLANFPNGYLPSGMLLAKVDATGLYIEYATAAAAGAGGTLAGHLFASVPVDPASAATADIAAALLWSGEVITNFLPLAPAAQLDATGRTDVADHIAYVTHNV